MPDAAPQGAPGTAPAILSRRDQEMAAVIAVGAAMATHRDYTTMLSQVIEAVCGTIDAESGGFMRYDPASEALVLQAPAFGVHAEARVARYRVALAEGGNAARVFLSREPYIANDAQHDPRFIQRFVRLFDTRNTITIPLVLGDRPLGIFHAINKRSGDFTADDCALLSVVAPLLASSLQAAHMFRAFEHERRQLERSLAVHARLLDTAVSAQGIEAVCATLHELLRRPLLLLDTLRRPLASFEWTVDPQRVARDLGQVATPDGLMARIDVDHGRARLALVAIPIAGERGGYLLVDEAAGQLDAIDVKALEQAATLLAIEIFKQRSLVAAETRAASALLIELFSQGVEEDVARRLLARLGVHGAGPWRVLALGFSDGAADDALDTPVHRHGTVLREALERALGSLRRQVRLMHWRDGFVIIADHATAERIAERAQLRRLQQAVAALDSLPRALGLRLGVGRQESAAASLGVSLKTAEQALRAIDRLGARTPMLRFEDLGVYRLLLGDQAESEHREFMQHVLEPVLSADAASARGQLLATLVALIGSNFNLAQTARDLDIHLNTVKYRLQQLRELFGGDPARGDLRLEIELALKIRQLHPDATRTAERGF